MRKYLLWFAVPFALSLVVAIHHEYYPQNTEHKSGVIPHLLPCDSSTTEDNSSKANRKHVWELAELYFGWPNGTTIWALVITFVVIGEQTLETRKAAKASVKAARAAKTQIEHLVNTERPFMMVEVRETGAGSFDFYAVNYGKSPAQLVFINRVPIVFVQEFEQSYESKPWYGYGFYEANIVVINEPWIPPGKDTYLGTLDEAVIKAWISKHPGVSTGDLELLAYGAIKYRGRFSEEVWHSKYCYRTYDGNIRMYGPYGYNDYT